MEEQTSSPAATAENTNQRNGDEVRVGHPAASSGCSTRSTLLSADVRKHLTVALEITSTCTSVHTNTTYLVRAVHIQEFAQMFFFNNV